MTLWQTGSILGGSRGVWDNMLARFRLHLEGLGVHGTPFGHHFGDLGDAWGAPKALLGPLGAPCGIPVPPWGPPGVLWGPPGGILGGSGGHFGAILGAFGEPKWTKKSLKFGPETRSYVCHVFGNLLLACLTIFGRKSITKTFAKRHVQEKGTCGVYIVKRMVLR